MLKLISNSVLASEIAEMLGKPLEGEDIVLYGPSNIKNIRNNSLIYIENIKELEELTNKGLEEILFLTSINLKSSEMYSFIKVENPRIELIKAVEKFFTIKVEHKIHHNAIIEEGAKLGENIVISAGCFIGSDVVIGNNSIIWENTIIKGKTKIGSNCVIKSNSTIGSDIFDFLLDDNGQWLQFPQIGEIIIEEDVWIGANSTVEKGTFGNTVIRKGCRIDDLVQIGSNSIIGLNSIVAAGSVISRDVNIGQECWIAPNVTIRDHVDINNEIILGVGAVVIGNLTEKGSYVGNPAKKINKIT